MKYSKQIFFLLTLALAAGCSPDRQLERIKNIEKKGRFYKAWEKYQEFAVSHPQHPRAPEAVFRAGLVAQVHFNDCFMAATFYDEVITRYPDSEPWARAALLQKNNCPDYFPLVNGSSWTEVDSDTKGKNARIEITYEPLSDDPKILSSQAGKLKKIYYAGDKKSLSQEMSYKKEQSELQEFNSNSGGAPIVILKWPIEPGTKWTTKVENRTTTYEIASIDKTISVAAGDFEGCLHVRSFASGDNAIKNDFYAPGIGHVMTSISSKTGEKRITELASYHIQPVQEFMKEGAQP